MTRSIRRCPICLGRDGEHFPECSTPVLAALTERAETPDAPPQTETLFGDRPMSYPCQCVQPCIDVEHIDRQIIFSRNTFGPGERRAGVIHHLRKEPVEIEEAGGDDVLSEWVDVIILALIKAKQA